MTRNIIAPKCITSVDKMTTIGFRLLCLCLIIIMIGCSITYKAVATYTDVNGKEPILLIGTVNANIMEGSGSFKFKGMKSELSCDGISERPYYIPSNFTCEGQRGRGFGSCSDGRTFKFEWEADECTLIHGTGKDSLGDSFYFTAGMNENEENDYINKIQNGMSTEEAKNHIKQSRENERNKF